MSWNIVLPELDVMIRGLSRTSPDPAVVSHLDQLIQDRRLFLVGWVRQGLLSRARDDRQFQRLVAALSPFPDLPITPPDHVAASALGRDLATHAISIQPAQALLWVMAKRSGAQVWSLQYRWRSLQRFGAPLHREA